MTMQRLALGLTAVNLALVAVLLTGAHDSANAGVIRGRQLEILDDQGRIRASIKLHPAGAANGVEYPETVVFRLINPDGRPGVKVGSSEQSAGLSVVGRSDQTRVQLIAEGTAGAVKVMDDRGREQIFKP